MKKCVFVIIIIIICSFLISACNKNFQTNQASSENSNVMNEQPNIVDEVNFDEYIGEIKKELMLKNPNNSGFIRELFDGSSWNEKLFTISDDESCLTAQNSSSIGIDGIFMMNVKLGFSEALNNKMSTTRAIDGTQNDENDKFKVSWKYHPDSGLQVIYEKKSMKY